MKFNRVVARFALTVLDDLAPYPAAYMRASVGNDSNFLHTIDGIIWTNP